MPIIKCPKCGQIVSASANFCNRCGTAIKPNQNSITETTMKTTSQVEMQPTLTSVAIEQTEKIAPYISSPSQCVTVEKNKRKTIAIIILSCVTAIFLLLSLTFFILEAENSNPFGNKYKNMSYNKIKQLTEGTYNSSFSATKNMESQNDNYIIKFTVKMTDEKSMLITVAITDYSLGNIKADYRFSNNRIIYSTTTVDNIKGTFTANSYQEVMSPSFSRNSDILSATYDLTNLAIELVLKDCGIAFFDIDALSIMQDYLQGSKECLKTKEQNHTTAIVFAVLCALAATTLIGVATIKKRNKKIVNDFMHL